MSVTGFNRARARLAAEHKKRIAEQKIIKEPVKIEPVIKEIKVEFEELPEVTEENKDEIKISKPKRKTKKRSKK